MEQARKLILTAGDETEVSLFLILFVCNRLVYCSVLKNLVDICEFF
jgi:hypothetical protein